MSTEARLRLSVDTASAQRDVKILDKEIKELGGNSKIDVGSESLGSIKDLITSQQKLIDSISRYMDSMERNTKSILSRLDNLKASTNKALKNDAENVYEQKLRELESKKKMMETSLVPVSGSGGGGGGTSNNLPALPGPSSGSGGNSKKLLDAISKLGVAAAALGAVRSTWNYVSTGAKSSQVSELRTYDIYNTSGYYDGDFSAGRNAIANNGAKYGYNVGETLSVQDTLMGMMGASSKEQTQADSNSILSTARALGLDENALAYGAGLSYQKGTYDVGDMSRYTNFFASSVKAAGMTGREDEQLEVLQSIQELLGKNLTTISENQMTSSLGLYSLLANANENLKGGAGASAVSSINEGITNGDNKMDLLLGWGTQYKGVAGRWALEQAKEQGISNPENLKNVFQNFERFTGQSIDSDSGKLALKNLFGVDTATIEALVSKKDEIISGNYSDELKSLIEDESGTKLVENELGDYNEDTALSEGVRYKVETENAQDRIGDLLNESTGWLKAIYNKLPNWAQSGASLGATAIGGALKGYGMYKIFDIVKGLFSGTSGGTSSTGGFFSKLFGKGGSSAAKAAAGASDDVVDAAYSVLDDAGNVVASFDDAGNVIDDVAGSAGNSVDDVLSATSGGSKILSKVGKVAKVAPYVIRGIEGIYDFATADDGIKKAEAVGGTAGGMGGIWAGTAAGGKAGAAIGTAIAPGIGTAIGGILGGVAGAIGGDKLGSWLGEELFGSVAENWKDAETNYGTGLASLPIIGGLWKKDGTLIQQQIKEEETAAAKARGGLPSDFGMPKIFDDLLNDNGSDIRWQTGLNDLGSENKYYRQRMENKFGMNKDEFEEWMHSDEYKAWQEAIGGTGWAGRNTDLNKNTDSQTQLRQSIDELNETIQDATGGNSSSVPNASEGKASEFIAANSVRDSMNNTSQGDGTYFTNPTGDEEYVSSSSTTSAKKGGGGILGWFKNLFGLHATGNDYIPYDGYLAELHKGEAVLTAHEADEWRKSSIQDAMKPELVESMNLNTASSVPNASEGTLNIVVSGKIDGMTETNQSEIVRAVVNIIQSATGTNAIMNQLGNNFVRFQN